MRGGFSGGGEQRDCALRSGPACPRPKRLAEGDLRALGQLAHLVVERAAVDQHVRAQRLLGARREVRVDLEDALVVLLPARHRDLQHEVHVERELVVVALEVVQNRVPGRQRRVRILHPEVGLPVDAEDRRWLVKFDEAVEVVPAAANFLVLVDHKN